MVTPRARTNAPGTPAQSWIREKASRTPQGVSLATPLPLRRSPRRSGDSALHKEIDRLRSENDKLRRQGSNIVATRSELALLRERNAELERKTSVGSAIDQPVAPPSLLPRGRGKPFSIKSWHEERKDRTNTGLAALQVMPASNETTTLAERDPSPSPASQVHPKERHGWMTQVSLTGECQWSLDACRTVRALLDESLRQAGCDGSASSGMSSFKRAFSLHLENFERPHLGFSALFPPFFATLRDHGPEDAGCVFECCAELLRGLLQDARFGSRPPSRRPADTPRLRYVRELCAQIGVTLDLVRLGFVERQLCPRQKDDQVPQKRKLFALEADKAVQDDVPAQSAMLPHASEGDSMRRAVSRKELSALLTRAGRYLQAVQMDMELLHDEAEEQARQAREASAFQANAGADSAEEAALATLALSGLDEDNCSGQSAPAAVAMLPLQDSEGPSSMSSPSTQTAAEAVPATLSLSLAAGDKQVQESTARAGAPEQSPSFGSFLDQQLLPLYVADVPFEYLRRIGESYCGAPLDSDDEDRAWQASGSTSELREQQQQQHHQRRQKKPSQRKNDAEERVTKPKAVAERGESTALVLQTAISDEALVGLGTSTGMLTTDLATAVAGNKDTKDSAMPLGRLFEAATKDTNANLAPLRAQMSHSIVEKRRRERQAPPDMALGDLRVRRSSLSASTNPATPVPNVSLALLQTPIPFNSPLASSLSPISVRGDMRRHAARLLESPMRFPEWGLLEITSVDSLIQVVDTPRRPKPS